MFGINQEKSENIQKKPGNVREIKENWGKFRKKSEKKKIKEW